MHFSFQGQDTTATSTAWAVYLLGHNLDIQEKCRKELFEVLGPDPTAPVSSEQLKMLRYIEAVVKVREDETRSGYGRRPVPKIQARKHNLRYCFQESMRVYAPIPLIGRQVEHDIKVKGACIGQLTGNLQSASL